MDGRDGGGADDSDTLLGSMSSHEEPRSRLAGTQGPRWRRLQPPVPVQAFVADTWVEVLVDDVNDSTGELRIRWPRPDPSGLGDAPHQILDVAHYRRPPGGFPG